MNPEVVENQIRDLETRRRNRPNETTRVIQHIRDERDRDISAIQDRTQHDIDARRREGAAEVRTREEQARNTENAEHLREANDMRLFEQEIRNARETRDRMRQPV